MRREHGVKSGDTASHNELGDSVQKQPKSKENKNESEGSDSSDDGDSDSGNEQQASS